MKPKAGTGKLLSWIVEAFLGSRLLTWLINNEFIHFGTITVMKKREREIVFELGCVRTCLIFRNFQKQLDLPFEESKSEDKVGSQNKINSSSYCFPQQFAWRYQSKLNHFLNQIATSSRLCRDLICTFQSLPFNAEKTHHVQEHNSNKKVLPVSSSDMGLDLHVPFTTMTYSLCDLYFFPLPPTFT